MSSVPRSDDAKLLRLCVKFHRRQTAVMSSLVEGDAALHVAMNARWAVSDKIEGIPARTPEGHRAKAAVALVLLDENYADSWKGKSLEFAWAALRDVAGEPQS